LHEGFLFSVESTGGEIGTLARKGRAFRASLPISPP